MSGLKTQEKPSESTTSSTTHAPEIQATSQVTRPQSEYTTSNGYRMLDTQRGPESVKLFVGQVPVTVNEAELAPIFLEYGNLHEVAIIRDRSSGAHRGCAFVTFEKKECADEALNSLHNKVLPITDRPIQVKYADGEQDKFEFKLFIGLVPKTATEDDLQKLFSPYGNVIECVVLRTPEGLSRGCAFIKYDKRESALAAIESLNQKYRMEGGNTEIVVRFADKKKKSQQQLQQQQQQQQQQITPENIWAMMYGTSGIVGKNNINNNNSNNNNNNNFNPYQPTLTGIPNQNLPNNGTFFPPGSCIAPNPPIAGNTPFTPYFNPAATGVATPGTAAVPPTLPGGGVPTTAMTGMPPISNTIPIQPQLQPQLQPQPQPPTATATVPGIPMSNQQIPPGNNPISNPQSGPIGANLFIYHLPQYFTDNDLYMTFSPFGNVISVKVFVDKQTGNSKCFGFVSYDSPSSAQLAISSMNGFQIGTKRLKVQLKKENNRPY